MKRPFAFIGFAYLTGLLAAFFFGSWTALVGLVCGAGALLLLCLRKVRNAPLKLSLAGLTLALAAALIAGAISDSREAAYAGGTHSIEGSLIALLEEREGTSVYNLEIDRVDEKAVTPFRVRFYSAKQFLFKSFDRLTCQAELKAFPEERGFSARKNYLSGGYAMNAYHDRKSADSLTPVKNKPPEAFILQVRQYITEISDRVYAETNGEIIAAMLLGEQNRVNDTVYEQFKLAGANHILVVSGMHLAVIASGILLLLQKLRLPRKLRFLLAICAVLAYMLAAGMGKSVLRSGMMYLILICSNLLGEEGDSLNALGFSVLFICGGNPWAAADIGFLLSVAATAGILQFSGKFSAFFNLERYLPERLDGFAAKRLRWILREFSMALSVSVSAYLFVMPVLLLFNPSVNPVSILSGTILALPSAGILVLALISLLLSAVPFLAPAAMPFVVGCNLLTKFMLWVVEGLAKLGGRMPVLLDGQGNLLFAGFMLVTAFCILFRPSRAVRRCWTAAVVVMIGVAITVSGLSLNGSVRLITADTGDGLFAFLLKGREAVVLSCDGYMGERAVAYLKRYGVTSIPYLCGDPIEDDAVAEALYREFPVGLVLSPAEYQRETSFTAFSDTAISLELFGGIISIRQNGKTAVLARTPVTSKILEADIVITEQKGLKVNSAFTLLRSDAIMDIQWPGNYILSKGQAYSVQLSAPLKIRRID